MKNRFNIAAKSLVLAIATLGILAFSHGVARADEVTISGSTTGTITGVPQLTFVGNPSFTGITALGGGSLSGANRLGTFSVSADSFQFVTGTFVLHITFTSPTGIAGGQDVSFDAEITGTVAPNPDEGAVFITFDTLILERTFDNGTSSGDFTLLLDVPAFILVPTGRSVDLNARIFGQQTSAVPEPATLLLLGTGLTGIAAKLRKRKKAREETVN